MHCTDPNDPDATPLDAVITFTCGGGSEVVPAIPEGWRCEVTETGTDRLPEGSQVSYDPGQVVTIGPDGAATAVINDFSQVPRATGGFTVAKAVVPPRPVRCRRASRSTTRARAVRPARSRCDLAKRRP